MTIKEAEIPSILPTAKTDDDVDDLVIKSSSNDNHSKNVSSFKKPSKWIIKMKRRSMQSLQRTSTLNDSNTNPRLDSKDPKNNTVKTSRIISLTANSFISKRLSSHNFSGKDISVDKAVTSSKVVHAKHPSEMVTLAHDATQTTGLSDISVISTTNSDRNSNISLSSASEKSAIGKSINAFKKTFTLFSDSNPSEQAPEEDESDFDFDETLTDDSHSIRRTLSYTESDRKRVISFVLEETNPKESRRIPSSAREHQDLPFISKASTSITRQRSKTIDAMDNPLIDNNESTGVLSSIANLVKLNKSSSTASLRTVTNPILESSLKSQIFGKLESKTPEELLTSVLETYPIVHVCEILSLNDNKNLKLAMSIYLEKYYDFKDLPLDMALRKFIMINYLPKETQQIDRLIYAFSKRYYECNSHIGFDSDILYILTYSIIMVHTDKFNPNNKRKMSRYEFVQNVDNAIKLDSDKKENNKKHVVLKEILGYFYDNMTYCPLIKLSTEQCETVLDSLSMKGVAFPYPSINFLNSNGSNYDTIKSSSSAASISTAISKSGSQSISSHPPLRKKSSSFLWTASTICDPYEYIVKNNIDELNSLRLLHDQKKGISISYDNPFLSLNSEKQLKSKFPSMKMIELELDYFKVNASVNLDTKQIQNIRNNMTNSVIDYIFKIEKSKGAFLMDQNIEAHALNDNNGKEYYLARVIKVGIIHKQEAVANSSQSNSSVPLPTPLSKTADELTTDSDILNNQKNLVWKPFFAILTTVGLFLFDNIASFRMRSVNSLTKSIKNTIIIEPTAPKHGMFKDFRNKDLMENKSIQSEPSGFMPFSYFRSERTESFKPLKPSLSLGFDSFATRKFQNLEYDQIVNHPLGINASNLSLDGEINMKTLPESMYTCRSDYGASIRAISGKKELNYTFFIYDKKSKSMYMVASARELASWIHCINAVNASSNVGLEAKPIDFTLAYDDSIVDIDHSKFYEVCLKRNSTKENSTFTKMATKEESPRKRSNTNYVPPKTARSHSIEWEQDSQNSLADSLCGLSIGGNLNKNENSRIESHSEYQMLLDEPENSDSSWKSHNHANLLEHLYAIQNLQLTMPMPRKTKEELLYTTKIMAVKLEWMWYEKCKLQAIALITEYLEELNNVIDGNNVCN